MDEPLPVEDSTAPATPAAPAATAATPSPPLDQGVTLQEQLGDKKAEAILAIINEPSYARAAALIGVHERTLRRWMDEPLFKRAYLAARRDAFSHAIGLTQRYAPVAVNTLLKVMTDRSTPPGIRVAAAGILLRFGREGIELDDLAQRVEFLEQTAQQAQSR